MVQYWYMQYCAITGKPSPPVVSLYTGTCNTVQLLVSLVHQWSLSMLERAVVEMWKMCIWHMYMMLSINHGIIFESMHIENRQRNGFNCGIHVCQYMERIYLEVYNNHNLPVVDIP